jgi:alanyl-tRNA synthetase
MRNHTATHLMHAALRKVLGDHVKQSGSYVGPDRLRFDFSHHQPMTPQEVFTVERIVNDAILENTPVTSEEMDIESARKSGAMALFGEKYADKVWVVSIGDFSKELCGGTHVQQVSQIGPFFITLETGIASGVRRIEAITGREATKYMLEAREFRQQTANLVGQPVADALEGVRRFKEDNIALQKELKRTKEAMFAGNASSVGNQETIGPIEFVTHVFGETDRDTMSAWVDSQKEADRPLVAIGIGEVNGKNTYVAAASLAAVKQYKINVGMLTKKLLPAFGGRGGGKPTYAQGSTADGTVPHSVFEKARTMLNEIKDLK